jgi:hypothetical protein
MQGLNNLVRAGKVLYLGVSVSCIGILFQPPATHLAFARTGHAGVGCLRMQPLCQGERPFSLCDLPRTLERCVSCLFGLPLVERRAEAETDRLARPNRSRDLEREILPMCRAHGMAIAPWNAIGGGKFQSKKVRGLVVAVSPSAPNALFAGLGSSKGRW